ncbi:cellulase 2 [Chrysochromulina tobinii]|uniref:Cellulase 2 n=1 Tax=Chrysochromulina tobinii TaxID=1460289 RepID=A0A0M0K5W7_9EUKA|nr:cellulase 2 [Chrysochromulina tobinii]|eukprot:KOO33783.1 cellulase 2 [Chrysochromulina sp. CCMP291]
MGIGASRSATDLFELSGRDGTLYASVSGDNAFHIKGINWFGSETYCGPPGGLDRHPVGFYLDFLQRHKFNAIRLLFAHEFIEKDDIVHTAESEDPLFFQTRYLEMFTILCREAAKRGMLVMVAAHRLRHDAWPGKGLWYDDDIGWPVSRVKTSWSKLAAVLCGEWNVHLSNQEKLVYSPHVYGPSVYQQHYFDDQRFPANMPESRAPTVTTKKAAGTFGGKGAAKLPKAEHPAEQDVISFGKNFGKK